MSIPTSMLAMGISKPGGPEVLQPLEVPTPRAGPGEVLIRVAAAGVNRPDVLQRRGLYAPPPGASPLPGLEVAGTIVEVGAGVEQHAVGDDVCALCNGGGYAAYVATPAGQVLPIPDGWSMVEAAGLPETYFTVWVNAFEHGRLAAGERFLVHGGTSGIGVTAIGLAKAFGATVMTTAGSDLKCEFCRGHGADLAVNYRTEDFVTAIEAFTDGEGIDVVLDMVGGDYVPRNLSLLRDRGRHVSIAFARGARCELDLEAVLRRRLVLTGSTLRPRTSSEKAAIARALRELVWPRLSRRELHPVVDHTYPLIEAEQAHRRMESSQHIGKIVLAVNADG